MLKMVEMKLNVSSFYFTRIEIIFFLLFEKWIDPIRIGYCEIQCFKYHLGEFFSGLLHGYGYATLFFWW